MQTKKPRKRTPTFKGLVFTLNQDQIRKLNIWLKSHDKTCVYSKPQNQGAIGGRLVFTFAPTTLGVTTKVICECKGEIDLSDYENW